MKLGIMQPYFFPYAGYFDLIDQVDRWVVFDVPKYNARSWMNRNRILHPREGWQYVTVPVNRENGHAALRDVRVADADGAVRRILGQLEHYRNAAPHYAMVRELVREAFGRVRGDLLTDLNVSTLSVTCEYLGIRFAPEVLSSMALDLPEISHPGQWALEIAANLEATEYVNPPGGRDIFRPEDWRRRGIVLSFSSLPDLVYQCGPYAFVEYLSILDVLMWNTPRSVMARLRAARPGPANDGPEGCR